MLITLSRQLGSLGDEIAGRVAAALDLALADREFIRRAALAAGATPESLDRLMYEEQRSLAAEVIESLSSSSRQVGAGSAPANAFSAVFAPMLRPVSVSLEETAQSIAAIIRAVAARDQVLFLGQGSQIVLRDQRAALHVQVVAPLELRVARVAERERLTRPAALRRVRSSDAARADYLARYYGANWLDPLLYHLVINTGLCSTADSVALIVEAARRLARQA